MLWSLPLDFADLTVKLKKFWKEKHKVQFFSEHLKLYKKNWAVDERSSTSKWFLYKFWSMQVDGWSSKLVKKTQVVRFLRSIGCYCALLLPHTVDDRLFARELLTFDIWPLTQWQSKVYQREKGVTHCQFKTNGTDWSVSKLVVVGVH